MPSKTPASDPSRSSNGDSARTSKRWAFRLGAIAVGLTPILLLEFFLALIGWKGANGVQDPYVGFTEIRPLFVQNVVGTQFEIATNRQPLFQPDSFSATKPENEFRIFCVGGSTVQGRPFSIETAFSQWLELYLSASHPSQDWKVINCGGVSYASYRLAPIVDELLQYQPDLIVLYTGHNEFLEDRTYAAIKNNPAWISRAHDHLSALRTYSLLRSFVVGSGEQPPQEILPVDVEARLDFKGGLELYHRDEPWKQKVAIDFERNLARMVSAIQDAQIPMILVNPVCNLRDVAPFKSENSAVLTPQQVAEFDSQWQTFLDSPKLLADPSSLPKLISLASENPQHAELQYRLGQAYLLNGNTVNAKRHLSLAKDEDICPLRATKPIYEAIARVQKQFDVPMVDAMAWFTMQAPDGIPGREYLVDHVHPTIYGHQQIGKLLFEKMRELDLIGAEVDEVRANAAFERHFESLDNFYFERAKDRLNGLQRWAEGRVKREKNDE